MSRFKRLIVQGEPHGCLDEVIQGLEAVGYNPHVDELWCLGDAVDRGPDPIGVLDLYVKFGANMVLGNHEYKLLRLHAWHERSARTGEPIPMPVDDDLRRTYALICERPDLIAWLQQRPIVKFFSHEFILLVHAGVLPTIRSPYFDGWTIDWANFFGRPKADRDYEDGITKICTSLRFVRWNDQNQRYVMVALDQRQPTDRFWAETWGAVSDPDMPQVIYGHQPWRQVRRHERATGIDTGCVFGGSLTTVVIPNGTGWRSGWEFHSTPAAKVYFTPADGNDPFLG